MLLLKHAYLITSTVKSNLKIKLETLIEYGNLFVLLNKVYHIPSHRKMFTNYYTHPGSYDK